MLLFITSYNQLKFPNKFQGCKQKRSFFVCRLLVIKYNFSSKSQFCWWLAKYLLIFFPSDQSVHQQLFTLLLSSNQKLIHSFKNFVSFQQKKYISLTWWHVTVFVSRFQIITFQRGKSMQNNFFLLPANCNVKINWFLFSLIAIGVL